MLRVVIPLAGVPAVLVTTSKPLVIVMMLLVLTAPVLIEFAQTVPLRMFKVPLVLVAGRLKTVVLPRTRLLFTMRVAVPLTLTNPRRGVTLAVPEGPRAWFPT